MAGENIQSLDTVDARHHHIDENYVHRIQIGQIARMKSTAGFYLIAQIGDEPCQKPTEGLIVVDDQNTSAKPRSDGLISWHANTFC
jgi:hypothetical protein